MTKYIGIDIGGTNIRVGAIDENENIIYSYKEPTFKDVKISINLYEKIKRLIKKVPEYEKAKAVGIGAPGSVDNNIGQIISSKNVSLLNNFPLVEKLKKDFKLPIYLENDARVAWFAEAIKGAGKNKKIVCYITISTGLGGTVVIDKKIYHGSNNLGAYFGAMILDLKNTCNSLISGTALIDKAKERINKDINNAFEIFELERNNNKIAREIIDEFKKNLTVLLLNISSIINPDIIILGGGVLKSKERFFPEVIEEFKNKAHPLAKKTVIDLATFEETGIMGASLLTKELLKNNIENEK